MSPPFDIRILAVGEVPPDVLTELAGFEADAVPGGTRLRGRVSDGAALWGVLHRLHRAGIGLRSVDRPGIRQPPALPATGADRTVRIAVEGHAAGVVAGAVTCTELTLSPPTTTFVLQLGDDDELFEVLGVLEALALEVRGIRVD